MGRFDTLVEYQANQVGTPLLVSALYILKALDFNMHYRRLGQSFFPELTSRTTRFIIQDTLFGVNVVTIRHNEEWVQIAFIDEADQIWFTAEFQEIMGELGWHAKKFVGHLLGLWYDPFEHMLDYVSGDSTFSSEQPGKFDANYLDEPQDVVEYWSVVWSKNNEIHTPTHDAGTGLGLNVDWYRDVLRAKLVSLRLPKRLLIAYKERFLALHPPR